MTSITYIQLQYLNIHVISEIFILTNINILETEAEYSDVKVQYLDFRTEYIRCLSHS